ncbi:choline kinase family protein [soil metagenome]
MLREELASELQPIVEAMSDWSDAEQIDATYISGGITNRNYRVTVDGTDHFVRLAGERTSLLGIDREHEKEALETAAQLGIAPEVVAFLPDHDSLVTAWIDGETLDAAAVRTADAFGPLVDAVRAFHDADAIPGRFHVSEIAPRYHDHATEYGVDVPDAYDELLAVTTDIEAAFAHHPIPDRPCHNDLLSANFIQHGSGVAIIDFEYAGMGDPFFDLGNLSVNNEFDDDLDHALLERYFGESTDARLARLKLMRIVSDFREAMWGVIQQGISTLDVDYIDYANQHFERCQAQVRADAYDDWLRTAAAAPV